MNVFSFLQSITFIRIRVLFEALGPIVLPRYKGSAYRGCLGESLRQNVCVHRGLKCEECSERFDCPFSQLFNSFVEPGHPHQRKYSKSPHPYIIDPLPDEKTDFEAGETFGFELTLIGKAIDFWSLLIPVFYRMGESGIGKGRGKFKPVELKFLGSNLDYESLPYFGQPERISIGKLPVRTNGRSLTLNLENPLRFMEEGQLVISTPEFGFFILRLAQRIGLLAHFYCGANWPEPELETIQEINGIHIGKSALRVSDWRRYSGTQDTKMNFDGLIGQITYIGEGINNWMPLLTMGSWLHVGSTATFGLGKYSIHSGFSDNKQLNSY